MRFLKFSVVIGKFGSIGVDLLWVQGVTQVWISVFSGIVTSYRENLWEWFWHQKVALFLHFDTKTIFLAELNEELCLH